MASDLVELVKTIVRTHARRNSRCSPWCRKCNRSIPAVFKSLPGLETELENLDVEQIERVPHWIGGIGWAYRSLSTKKQRDRVLTAWRRHMEDHLDFIDNVMFDIIDVEDDLGTRAGKAFLAAVVEAALESGNVSLTETLVWRLGSKIAQFPALLAQAIKYGETRTLVYDALAKAGFCPSRQQIEVQARRSAHATKVIFRAVINNDIAAVRAILAKRPDLTAVNEKGQTAAELARALTRDVILNLLDGSMSHSRTESLG